MAPAEVQWRWHALCLPKYSCAPSDCEDAWAADPAAGRFAVADGASECAFGSLWARLLAEAFVRDPPPAGLSTWLQEPRHHWLTAVMSLDLPWYAEIKREEGAFATLLGLDLCPPQPRQGGAWSAVAVGDTCLVRVRERQVQAFPVVKAAEFEAQPALLKSHDAPLPVMRRCAGLLRRGDRLFLMTDALARWFLGEWEQGGRPWDTLAALLAAHEPEAAFSAWVAELRAADTLRDDDVTLLSVEYPPADPE
jgi:hypothetical protein